MAHCSRLAYALLNILFDWARAKWYIENGSKICVDWVLLRRQPGKPGNLKLPTRQVTTKSWQLNALLHCLPPRSQNCEGSAVSSAENMVQSVTSFKPIAEEMQWYVSTTWSILWLPGWKWSTETILLNDFFDVTHKTFPQGWTDGAAKMCRHLQINSSIFFEYHQSISLCFIEISHRLVRRCSRILRLRMWLWNIYANHSSIFSNIPGWHGLELTVPLLWSCPKMYVPVPEECVRWNRGIYCSSRSHSPTPTTSNCCFKALWLSIFFTGGWNFRKPDISSIFTRGCCLLGFHHVRYHRLANFLLNFCWNWGPSLPFDSLE